MSAMPIHTPVYRRVLLKISGEALMGAGQYGIDVHLFEGRAAVFEAGAGDDRQVGDLGRGAGPPVCLDVPDHHIGAPLAAPPALIEHGEGLPHPRGRPEVDPQRAGVAHPRIVRTAPLARNLTAPHVRRARG